MANFVEDSKLVNWLTVRGVQFEYKEGINVSELTHGWDLVNHGRHDGHPVDDDLILKYSESMQNGAAFPAPILSVTPGGYEVLDGCQRLSSAHMLKQTIFNGYVIKTTSPSIRASIRVCANSVLNGQAPSQEWTIAKVVETLHEQYGFTAVDCGLWSGQPVKKIEQEIASRHARLWLNANGVDVNIKPANQRGFQSHFWDITTPEMRENAPKEIKKVVTGIQKLKSTNGEANHLASEVFTIKTKRGVDIKTQIDSKMKEVFGRPEIRARLQASEGPRSQHPIDNAIRQLTGCLTSFRQCGKDDLHADAAQSDKIVMLLAELKTMAKKIVPRELWATVNDIVV